MTSRSDETTPDGALPRRGDTARLAPDLVARLLARRIVLLLLAGATIVLGLAVHWGIPGATGDFLADALYAVLIYLLVGVIAPRAPTIVLFAVSFGFCFGLELFQLTGIPLQIADVFSPARLILGTTFVMKDIVAYAIGAGLVAVVDAVTRRATRARRT